MKKIDATDKILYILMGLLVIFAAFIFVNQKYGFIGNKYEWNNGGTTFTVYKTKLEKVNFYRIPIFFEGGDEYYPLTLRYGPREVDDIPVEGSPKGIMADDSKVLFTVDPTPEYTVRTAIGMKEVEEILVSKYFYGKQVVFAATEAYMDKEEVTCDDASSSSSVVWFRLGDSNRVFAEGECVIVQGTTEEDIVRASDRLVLHLLGISP